MRAATASLSLAEGRPHGFTELPVWLWPIWLFDAKIERMVTAVQRLGENVKAARHDRDLTQEDLAALSDLSVVQISRIEGGKREIRLTTLLKLINGLQIEPQDLLRGMYKRSVNS
jgi:DNA-binding Xre family transcriptional regulator